jgi:hypothetical protein
METDWQIRWGDINWLGCLPGPQVRPKQGCFEASLDKNYKPIPYKNA